MLRKIEYLIPAALQAIDQTFSDDIQGNGIPSGYQSAVSGFGTTIIQMGLLPTLAVYADEDSGSGIVRKKLIEVLIRIIKHDACKLPAELKQKLDPHKSPLSTVATDKAMRESLKEHLLQASLAFKLAIRTYKLKKP